MHTMSQHEWQSISEQAQHEVYDFFLFIKQRHGSDQLQDTSETITFSNHSANLIADWKEEDSVWK